MPLEALRDLGQDVEFLVGTRRSAKAVRGMFLGSLQGVETAGPYLGLQLNGLASVAASSEDLLSTVWTNAPFVMNHPCMWTPWQDSG